MAPLRGSFFVFASIYSVAPFVVGADAHIRPRLQAKIGR